LRIERGDEGSDGGLEGLESVAIERLGERGGEDAVVEQLDNLGASAASLLSSSSEMTRDPLEVGVWANGGGLRIERGGCDGGEIEVEEGQGGRRLDIDDVLEKELEVGGDLSVDSCRRSRANDVHDRVPCGFNVGVGTKTPPLCLLSLLQGIDEERVDL
jgi:hypothetical protein